MVRLRTLTIGIATTALASGALAMGGATTAHAAHHQPAAAAKHGVTVSTTHSKLGTFIVGPNGHTLYLFEKDTGTKSKCYRACASEWPPLITKAAPQAAGKTKSSKLGTTKRKDGSLQVTYNGHPMYYFEPDTKAGQTRGEGSHEFGHEWLVVNPKGQGVDDD